MRPRRGTRIGLTGCVTQLLNSRTLRTSCLLCRFPPARTKNAQVRTLTTNLKEKRMHWRFEVMTANFLELLLRDDATLDLDAEWSVPCAQRALLSISHAYPRFLRPTARPCPPMRHRFYSAIVSDLPPARVVGMAAVTHVLYFLKAPIDRTARLRNAADIGQTTQHKLLLDGPSNAEVRVAISMPTMLACPFPPTDIFRGGSLRSQEARTWTEQALRAWQSPESAPSPWAQYAFRPRHRQQT